MVSKKILLPILIVAVAIPAYYLLSPLFVNVTIREELQTQPRATATVDLQTQRAATVGVSQSFVVLAAGNFNGADDFHRASGVAKLIRMSDGSYIVRLEGFQVTNGPDLFVYLANNKDASGNILDLGRLKGNIGDQNYPVPSGMNPESYTYVLIWCKAFRVLFGYAQLVKA